MRTIFAAIVPLLLCAAPASAQSPLAPTIGKTIDLGLGYLLGGWATGPAWAVGGGVDYRVSDSIAIRSGVDYMRTTYFDSTVAVRGQSNIRSTVTILYSFVKRSRKRRLA